MAFDLSSVVKSMQKKWEHKDPAMARSVGTGSNLPKLTEKDFIKMPDWWQQATNTLGIPFGRIVMLAGDSDSGKTSAAIEAMRAAQEQGCAVIYVETEGKTSEKDLAAWGVKTDEILVIKNSITEMAFELMFESWDLVQEKYPDTPILIVFDSIGNTVSFRDSEIDITDQKQKPGGKGQINRLALNKLISKREEGRVALLVINYVYANIGSPGKTNAGGKAINFFSSLTYQTSRKAWVERTVKGEKVRVGAKVVWTLFKNHINKDAPGHKVIELDITADGVEFKGGKAGGEGSTEAEEAV